MSNSAWSVVTYRDSCDRVVEELREVVDGVPQIFGKVERYLLHTVGVNTARGEMPLPIRIRLDDALTINEAFSTIEKQIEEKAEPEAKRELERMKQKSQRSQLTAGIRTGGR